MNGKELFEGMSYIDERFVEEAETQSIPRRKSTPWIHVASMAACLCLILGGAAALGYYGNMSGPQKDREDLRASEPIISTAPQLPPDVAVTEHSQTKEVPSVILRVDQMTEQGFIGTVTELVDADFLEIGTELNVVFAEGTRNEVIVADADEIKSEQANYVGSLIAVRFLEYDPETDTIFATLINQIEPGKDD